jgi:hypothetical protein
VIPKESIASWFDANGAVAVAKTSWDESVQRQSVYRVRSAQEEAQAIAAHYLTLGRSNLSPVFGLRVSRILARQHGLVVETSAGQTGVRNIDDLHRDLLGPPESFKSLSEALHASMCKGEDVFGVWRKDRSGSSSRASPSEPTFRQTFARCARKP